MTQQVVSPSPTDLRRISVVCDQTGLSAATIYRRASTGQFPKPIKIGLRASAWVGREVDAWIATQIARRDER